MVVPLGHALLGDIIGVLSIISQVFKRDIKLNESDWVLALCVLVLLVVLSPLPVLSPLLSLVVVVGMHMSSYEGEILSGF
jgi:divalent metal cation (Fe/Co/Zn/Cd) transporter